VPITQRFFWMKKQYSVLSFNVILLHNICVISNKSIGKAVSHLKPFSKFGYLMILVLVNYHSSLSSAVSNWILYVTNTSGVVGPPSYAVLPITIPSSGTPTQTLSTINTTPNGPNPMNIAITPDSELAVVVSSDGVSNQVSLLNLAQNAVINFLTNAGNGPVAVAITPDGNRAYVPNSGDNTVSSIDIKNKVSLQLHTTIPVGICR
jgi:YVTN family beta-propeller protein